MEKNLRGGHRANPAIPGDPLGENLGLTGGGKIWSHMYSETGALEMVCAGGCRLLWLPRLLL